MKNSMLGLVAVGALISAAALAADAPTAAAGDCTTHFSAEGSFFAGHKYTTWIELPKVAKADAWSKINTSIVKDGWNITSSDKDSGIISAAQSVSFGKGSTAPLTILIESSGNGSKATATFRTGGGQTTKEDTVKEKLCSYLGAAGI